ncbi:MAG: Slp family lipoprotein [Gammaproteobacteria bacterium]|nr:Slp family lipoprotein [Gammaproteobacteria bacterium]
MRIQAVWLLCFFGGILLAGCATRPPFELAGVDTALTPAQAAADIGAVRSRRVEWGGVIVAAKNLADRTNLEVLAYPLDRSARPERRKSPLGRFILQQRGYLETIDYAPGRLITAVGTVVAAQEGHVGKAPYRFAVLNAEQLHLWPKRDRVGSKPSVQFGVGIGYFR